MQKKNGIEVNTGNFLKNNWKVLIGILVTGTVAVAVLCSGGGKGGSSEGGGAGGGC